MQYIIHKVEDVTAQVQHQKQIESLNQHLATEQELRRQLEISKELYRAAEEVAGVGSYEVDLQTNTFYFSDGLYQLFGEVPQSFKPTLDWIDARSNPDDAATVRRILEKATQDKKPYFYTRRIRRPNGEWRTVESHGKVLCNEAGEAVKFIGLVQDITEKVTAERELKGTKEFLRTSLDSSPFVIQIFKAVRNPAGNITDFTWIFTNKAWNDKFGNAVGKSLLAQNPGVVETGLFDDFVNVTETGIPFNKEQYYNHEQFDGWFHQTMVKLGDGFVMTTEDITNRIKNEQELKQSRELLQTTIDSSLDLIQVFEAVRNEQGEITDFRWILNNQTAEQAFGQVIGKSLLTLNPGVVEEGIFETFKNVVETGQPNQTERYYVHEQFNGWYYQSTVKLNDGVATTTTDITQLKRSEQEIIRLKEEIAQKATDKYYSIFNAIDEGFCIYEVLYENEKPVDLRWLEVNPAYEKQTGLKNVVGKLHSELAVNTEPYWFEMYDNVLKTGHSVHFESYHQPTGRWYHTFASPLGNPESKQVAVVLDDITERKKAEKTLQESEERKAFMLKLSDALRPITSTMQVEEAATRVALEYFKADRCYYCQIIDDQSVIRRDAAKPGLPSVAGVYPLNSIPVFKAVLEAGVPFVVHNVLTAKMVDELVRQRCQQLQVISFINIPVIKNDKAVGILCVVQTTPRTWTPLEVELAEEVAERTWAAVERAKTEEALRESEERFRSLVMAASNQVYKMSPDWQYMYNLKGKNFLADTSNPESTWIEKYIPAPERERMQQAINQAIKTKSIFELEHQVFDAQGNIAWVYSRAVPMLNENGEITEWIGAGSDITKRKDAEEAVVKSEKSLQELNENLEQNVSQRTAELLESKLFTEQVMEASPDFIMIFNLEQNKIDFVNRDAYLGDEDRYYETMRIGYEQILERAHPEDQENLHHFIQSFRTASDHEVHALDYRVLRGEQVTWYRTRGKVFKRNEQGQATHYISVVQDITKLKQLEEENLHMRLSQQKALLLAILDAQEEERRRISESLHNGVGQLLYATKLTLEQVSPDDGQALEYTRTLLTEAISETRRVSHELVPIVLRDFGLKEALQDLCRTMQNQSLFLRCHINNLQVKLEDYMELALYRISQELVINIIKHAEATQATLQFGQEGHEVVLQARDNGKGIITNQKQPGKGIGLRTIEDRVKLLNGSMVIGKPKNGKGTEITIRISVHGQEV